MHITCGSTIGRPVIHVEDPETGFSLRLTIPMKIIVEVVTACASDGLHNGDEATRESLLSLAQNIITVFSKE